MRKTILPTVAICLLALFATTSYACFCVTPPTTRSHERKQESDRVYTVDEVDVKAKVKNRLEHLPKRKDDCPDPVQVTLKAILRKSGEVTDVKVIKASGCSFDQEAIKAVRKLKFTPALKDGSPVSQYSEIKYEVTSGKRPGGE